MTRIIQAFGAVIMPLLLVAGIVVGFYLPIRLFGDRPGFLYGMAASSILTLLFSVMGAHLLGGWGEEYLGTRWGVPMGITTGTLTISIALNCIAGFAGALLYSIFHR